MNETVRQIHNMAMELSQLAEMKKAKDGAFDYYNNYMKAAYELELYAALKVKEPSDNQFWRATLLRSAGWLAYQCGFFEQAKHLAEMGLELSADGYVRSKLEDLKNKAEENLKLISLGQNKSINKLNIIYGRLYSADVEANQINIREKEGKPSMVVIVPNNRMQHIARYFLGEKVEVEAYKDNLGVFVLEDIRWAA